MVVTKVVTNLGASGAEGAPDRRRGRNAAWVGGKFLVGGYADAFRQIPGKSS